MCTLITSKCTDIDENIANQNHATRTRTPKPGYLNLSTFGPGLGLVFMATCVHSEILSDNQRTTSQHIKIHKINYKILGQSEPVSKK